MIIRRYALNNAIAFLAIVGIVYLCRLALLCGFDGVALAASVGALGSIVLEKIRNR